MAHSIEDMAPLVAAKYGWDLATAETKIRRTQEILQLTHPIGAIEFLLETVVPKQIICDGCNARSPSEHRCYGSRAKVGDEWTGKACQCPDCFVMNNLVIG